MFAASALATVIFGGRGCNGSDKDYSYEFSRLHGRLDTIEGKIDTLVDNQAFMRARSCLEHFSPSLLDGVRLNPSHYSIQDIMEAAQEGFDILCKTACADEKCFPEAYKIFSETWGKVEWVNDKFGKEIDKWTEKIADFDKKFNECKEKYESKCIERRKIIFELIKNPPVICKFFVSKKKINEIAKKLCENDYILPELDEYEEKILRHRYASEKIEQAFNLPKIDFDKEITYYNQMLAFSTFMHIFEPGFTKYIENMYKQKEVYIKNGYTEEIAEKLIKTNYYYDDCLDKDQVSTVANVIKKQLVDHGLV